MKKRLHVLLLILALLGLSIGVTSAQGNMDGVVSMAGYFPQDTAMFAAFTMPDSAYLDAIDSFYQGYDAAQFGLQPGSPTTVRELFNVELAKYGTDIDTMLSWFGDYGAMGVGGISPSGEAENTYLIIQVADRDGLESFITENTSDGSFMRASQDGYTLYLPQNGGSTILAINDDWLIGYEDANHGAPTLPSGATLLDNADFQATVAAFPEDGYSNMLYLDLPTILATADYTTLPPEIDLSPESVGPWGIATTFVDDTTILVDSVQMPGTNAGPVGEVQAVDPDFMRFIPDDASFVIQATNLTGLYDRLMTTLTDSTESAGGEDPQASIKQALAMFGLDLKEDVLSWTTGDYALFVRADIIPVVVAAMDERIDVNGRFDFGLVIEATDPEKAALFAQRLSNTLRMFTAQSEEVTASEETINGVDVTVFSLNTAIPGSDPLSIDLLLGASDDVFFLATRDAAEAILKGDGGLAANTNYIEAQKYLLPNPTSVTYGDAEGMIVGIAVPTVGVLALLGPAIGNVYEGIIDDLENPQSFYIPPQPQYAKQTNPDAQALRQLEEALKQIHSMTVSSTVTADGATLIRLAIMYNR